MSGVQLGVVSQVNVDLTGFQMGAVYGRVYGKMSGLQLGAINQAGDASGVQFGVINIAESMNGLQIGLWNQINSKEHLNILPLVNWSFLFQFLTTENTEPTERTTDPISGELHGGLFRETTFFAWVFNSVFTVVRNKKAG